VRRREFIRLFGGAMTALPINPRAQALQSAQLHQRPRSASCCRPRMPSLEELVRDVLHWRYAERLQNQDKFGAKPRPGRREPVTPSFLGRLRKH
jgi:hypothetical protein